MPDYLYHATSSTLAPVIARLGLECRSKGAKDDDTLYLCMSGDEGGATTRDRRASDVIFRVAFASLNSSAWRKAGAGKEEWRGTEAIGADKLEYRRFLGTESQKTWRSAADYPTGLI